MGRDTTELNLRGIGGDGVGACTVHRRGVYGRISTWGAGIL